MESIAVELVLVETSTQASHDLFINTDPYGFIFHVNLNRKRNQFFNNHLLNDLDGCESEKIQNEFSF